MRLPLSGRRQPLRRISGKVRIMDRKVYENYVAILKKELVLALGCTEPIAIAYAGALVRRLMGKVPERIETYCSGNIVKNVKAVTVPNSNGSKGIEVAATLGVLGGDPDQELAVLQSVTEEDIKRCKELVEQGFCRCSLVENVANLYIRIVAFSGEETAEVELRDYHRNVTKLVKNGEVIFEKKEEERSEKTADEPDYTLLNVKDILTFADTVDLKDVEEILDRQIRCNTAISEEGLRGHYGAEVGRTYLEDGATDVRIRAKARAAAGSDARMSGCPLPVVINSGSGNQGITATMPVVEYAEHYGVSREKLLRSLVVSNLVALHQKRYIGSLSAYCGAVSAACGSGAGIAYMEGMPYERICDVITNCIASVGGMVCDGAKPSCAAKIAVAVEAALMAVGLSRKQHAFRSGEGLVMDDIEKTIAGIGRVGRVGMKPTDVEILNIMLGKIKI